MPAANTLNFTVTNVGTVAGPLLAGVMIAKWGGFAVAYAIDALLFTVALYAALRLPPLPPLAAGAHLARPGLRSVIDGLRFIGARPVLLMSFGVDIIAMVFAMPRALFPRGGGGAVRRAVRGRLAVRGDLDRRGDRRAVLAAGSAGCTGRAWR